MKSAITEIMQKPDFTLPFRVILCHYNEIGLKAPQYKRKLEASLIENIKKICKREMLTLQSALSLQDRLLFFFPSDQIPKAIAIFRHIIGIQSISPAITVDRNLDKIATKLLVFSDEILQEGDQYWVKFKSITALNRRFEEIEMDLARNIAQFLEKRGKNVKFKRGKAKKMFFVEMREKGAYIYSHKIPTLWGGMPQELNKSMFAEWLGSTYDCVASHILHHRGTIILPIIYDFGGYRIEPERSDIDKDLAALAKYYPEGLIIGRIQFASVAEAIERSCIPKDLPCPYCIWSRMTIMNQLIAVNPEKRIFTLENYTFHPKGTVTSNSLPSSALLKYFQAFPFVTVYPLVAFTEMALESMKSKILNQEHIISSAEELQNLDSISLSGILLCESPTNGTSQNLRKGEMSHFCPIQDNCKLYQDWIKKGLEKRTQWPSIEDIEKLWEIPKNRGILNQVIEKIKVERVYGQILTQEAKIQLSQQDMARLIPPQVLENIGELINYLGHEKIIESIGAEKTINSLMDLYGKQAIVKIIEDVSNSHHATKTP